MSDKPVSKTKQPPKGGRPPKPKPSMTPNPKLLGRSIIGGSAPKDS